MVCSPGKEEWHCEWIGDTQKHCIKQCVLFVYTKSVKKGLDVKRETNFMLPMTRTRIGPMECFDQGCVSFPSSLTGRGKHHREYIYKIQIKYIRMIDHKS